MNPLTSLADWLRANTPVELKAYYWAAAEIYTSPWFYAFVAVILFLEHLRPAVREQRVFSRGLLEDFLWFNLDTAFKVAALPAFIGLLHLAYTSATGGFQLSRVSAWPLGAKVLVSFLAIDFLQWLHHWVRHRIAALWHFHVIHHSQRQLNLFTDLRVHSVEYLVAQVVTFVPIFAFGLKRSALLMVGFSTLWYTRLIHANIRTNFGPLKHLLVSPQYHRIHHSIAPEHQNKNFGVILTVWDRLFGTLYPHYDEYPPTGVEGVEWTPPARLAPIAWLRLLLIQIWYPFRQLFFRRPPVQ